jgi:hypothetical protein
MLRVKILPLVFGFTSKNTQYPNRQNLLISEAWFEGSIGYRSQGFKV